MPEKIIVGTTAVKAIKASSLGIATSTGGISLGMIQIAPDMIVLAFVGLVVSILAFGYDYHHADNESDSMMSAITNAGMYMLFGFFTLPAAFMATRTYVTDDVMSCMLGGVFAAWTSVYLAKTLKTRLGTEINGRKI
ncbi:MAG: hypothetical protein J7L15_06265 [Clostridiales bacterium]|nr:hypothetical protein [Clostridiales bacterium]